MANSFSILAGFPAEMSAVMTGSAVTIGTLLNNPSHLIFNNQGTASVAISFDGGSTTWMTFVAGQALVLDLRAAHGLAEDLTLPIGTIITGTGASGTFSVSLVYAKRLGG